MQSKEMSELLEEASEYVDMAHCLMCHFSEIYLDTEKARQSLHYDLEDRFVMVIDFFNSFFDFVCKAKKTLSIYTDPKGYSVECLKLDLERKLNLIKQQQHTEDLNHVNDNTRTER